MSDNKKYYYFRLKENYFEQDAVKILESFDNGFIYSLILIKLHLKALEGDGCIMFNGIPYQPEHVSMLAKVIGHDTDHVRRAMALGIELRIIVLCKNDAFWIREMQNYIGHSSTEADRKRMYKLRMDGKLIEEFHLKNTSKEKNPPEIEIEIEKDIKPQKKSEVKTKKTCKDFEIFWSQYPRKVEKATAYKKYEKTKRVHGAKVILEALKTYKKQLKNEGTEPRFIKHGSTFLNNIENWISEGSKEPTEFLSRKDVLSYAKGDMVLADRLMREHGLESNLTQMKGTQESKGGAK